MWGRTTAPTLPLNVPDVAAPAPSRCGPLDVAFVLDDTGSMGGTIANIKTGITSTGPTTEQADAPDRTHHPQAGPRNLPVAQTPLATPIRSALMAVRDGPRRLSRLDAARTDMEAITRAG